MVGEPFGDGIAFILALFVGGGREVGDSNRQVVRASKVITVMVGGCAFISNSMNHTSGIRDIRNKGVRGEKS